MIRLSQPKIEVLKQCNDEAASPFGSRHATFKSLAGDGLLEVKAGKYHITEKGKTHLKRVSGQLEVEPVVH
jgi:predicted transcriptional regulator